MGQRQMTYVIVQEEKNKTIFPIYNQWNFVGIQIPKLIRGIEAVKKTNFKYTTHMLPYIYFIHAGLVPSGEIGRNIWVGGNDENYYYKDGTYSDAYQEDNNNGWNIVKFNIYENGDVDKIELYCIPGSEDKNKIKKSSIKSYFYESDKKDVQYLEKNCKWNPRLKAEARTLILKLINEK